MAELTSATRPCYTTIRDSTLRSPCCVRYEQDDHADRRQVPAIVRLGRFCAPVPSPGAALTRRATSGRRAGCAHDRGHECVDCRRLPTAFLRNALNRRASQLTHGQAGRMPLRDNEQGHVADVRWTARTAADSSSDSNAGGSRRSAASCCARAAEVTDAYERL
jgi:hypothetical protein